MCSKTYASTANMYMYATMRACTMYEYMYMQTYLGAAGIDARHVTRAITDDDAVCVGVSRESHTGHRHLGPAQQ